MRHSSSPECAGPRRVPFSCLKCSTNTRTFSVRVSRRSPDSCSEVPRRACACPRARNITRARLSSTATNCTRAHPADPVTPPAPSGERLQSGARDRAVRGSTAADSGGDAVSETSCTNFGAERTFSRAAAQECARRVRSGAAHRSEECGPGGRCAHYGEHGPRGCGGVEQRRRSPGGSLGGSARDAGLISLRTAPGRRSRCPAPSGSRRRARDSRATRERCAPGPFPGREMPRDSAWPCGWLRAG